MSLSWDLTDKPTELGIRVLDSAGVITFTFTTHSSSQSMLREAHGILSIFYASTEPRSAQLSTHTSCCYLAMEGWLIIQIYILLGRLVPECVRTNVCATIEVALPSSYPV